MAAIWQRIVTSIEIIHFPRIFVLDLPQIFTSFLHFYHSKCMVQYSGAVQYDGVFSVQRKDIISTILPNVFSSITNFWVCFLRTKTGLTVSLRTKKGTTSSASPFHAHPFISILKNDTWLFYFQLCLDSQPDLKRRFIKSFAFSYSVLMVVHVFSNSYPSVFRHFSSEFSKAIFKNLNFSSLKGVRGCVTSR